MTSFRRIIHLFTLLIGFSSCIQQAEESKQPDLKLWYDQPADASIPDKDRGDDKEWLSALPLGNGSFGAMVFGDVNLERIQLNEESMWSGSPAENDNPEAAVAIPKIRGLLFEGNYEEATALTNATQICTGVGSGRGRGANAPFGCFQTLGDLWIKWADSATYTDYYRELDLNDAVARVSYQRKGVKHQREVLASYPDQVIAINFKADKPGQISFSCVLDRPERYSTYVDKDQLIMSGALDNGQGGNGLEYMVRLKAVSNNGKVYYQDDELIVENADEVTLFLSASTDYVLDYPVYKGRDYQSITLQNIQEAANKSFQELKETHIQDHSQYFNRVSLDLTPNDFEPIPTDERLKQFKETKSDQHLEELLFQYGRYLLISSSRPGTLPANLQGIWANKIQTPWNGDYHTDVNIQMNYWPAEVTNLSEIHLPMFDLINSLVTPGMKTAKTQYNMNGWVVHPITNVWGYTSPGERANWGMHTGAAAWLCSHVMEHYRYTNDIDFLKEMYPVLKSSVVFYLDWLVKHPESGMWVSGPAVSPENTFIAPDGSKSQISMGPAHDQQVIWQLFSDFIQAAELLNLDDEFRSQVQKTKDGLLATKIGSDGRLMEWPEEFEEVEPGHRHISHLFALHPGSQITPQNTPELAEAAEKSLNYRIANGGGHTGWSAAWLISQYARLGNGEKAKESLNTVLSKSTSTNMFGLHPPFQMDANFGSTAGIAEMLIQSHQGFIELLPALPADWSEGTVKGLRTRGGFEVDMHWAAGKLIFAKVKSLYGNEGVLKYKDEEVVIALSKDEVGDYQF